MSPRLLRRRLPRALLALLALGSIAAVSATATAQTATTPAPSSGPYQVLIPNGIGTLDEALKRGVGLKVACLDTAGKASACTLSGTVTVTSAEAKVLGLSSTVIAHGKALTPPASSTPYRTYDIPLTHPSRFRHVAVLGVTITGTVTAPDGKKTKIPTVRDSLTLEHQSHSCNSRAPGLLIKAHPRKPYCPAATGGIAGADW